MFEMFGIGAFGECVSGSNSWYLVSAIRDGLTPFSDSHKLRTGLQRTPT